MYTCTSLIVGERLTELEVEDLLKHIDLTEDLEGNVKYEGGHLLEKLVYIKSVSSSVNSNHYDNMPM